MSPLTRMPVGQRGRAILEADVGPHLFEGIVAARSIHRPERPAARRAKRRSRRWRILLATAAKTTATRRVFVIMSIPQLLAAKPTALALPRALTQRNVPPRLRQAGSERRQEVGVEEREVQGERPCKP